MGSHYAATFRQTFHRRPLASTDLYGDEEHGPAEAHACREERQPRLVRDVTGSQVVATGRLFTEVQVALTDLIYLPGDDPEDEGSARKVLSVAHAVDLESGLVDHYEVYY